MSFSSKKSWRLRFIDIDSSFTLIPSENPINGYIVARAPKGTTRPTYFPRQASQAIDALIGVPSAHWPDLIEAKSFNDEYPIYISAPAGTSAAYPSYIGGFYITKNGMYKFYNITDKYELVENTGNAYKVKVQPGREQLFNSDFENRKSKIIIQSDVLEDYVPSEEEPGFGIFEFRKETNTALIIEKNSRLNVTDLDYDAMKNGIVSPVGTIKTYWGDNDVEDPIWFFDGQTATLADFGIKYSGTDPRTPLKDFIGQANYDELVGDGTTPPNSRGLMKLLVDGWYTNEEDVTFAIPFGLQDIISFLVTIKEDVYAYFSQKCATEKVTDVKISAIGYDKYRYDLLLPYAPYDKTIYEETGQITIALQPGMTSEEKAAIAQKMADNEFVIFYDPDKPDEVAFLGQYYVPEDLGVAPYYKDAISMYITKIFTCQANLYGEVNDNLFHKIFNIVGPTEINHLLTEEENIALYGTIDGPLAYIAGMAAGISAPKNNNFNAITLSCSEEVYAGKVTSGGEFTGSLDEMGKDTYGANIYWPEVLHDDDMSFLEVRIIKKFGDDPGDLDATGFWTYKRVVDPYDMDKDGAFITEKNFTLEGDRYATLLMTMNLLEQKTGGIWREEWYPIINEGLVEALNTEYDDVYIFMEPTGQEMFKEALATISRTQEFAAVISPKILAPNNRGVFTNQFAERVVVNGRVSTKSNAQYAGEFEVYDPITYKKYWCQPIGDVACNIARIFERKYGGWAPAWYNIAGDLGGQLKRTVLRSKYTFEDEATHTLDTKGVNPIIFTSDDGLMILSQKTTQDPNFTSDWSWLGHSLSFQLVKREIRDSVMRPQIMKPINDYWMGLRQGQVENILAKRTGGSSPIWAIAICDIQGQNTALTRAQRNFVIKVDVKVHVFSEVCTLILENHAQDWQG